MFADLAFEYPANSQAAINPLVANHRLRRRVSDGRDAACRPCGVPVAMTWRGRSRARKRSSRQLPAAAPA